MEKNMNILYISKNELTGKKLFGMTNSDEIKSIVFKYRMNTGSEMKFTKCISNLDLNKSYKILFYLKFHWECEGLYDSYNSFNKFYWFNDTGWTMTLEEYVDLVCSRIQWFGDFKDITKKINEQDFSQNGPIFEIPLLKEDSQQNLLQGF